MQILEKKKQKSSGNQKSEIIYKNRHQRLAFVDDQAITDQQNNEVK